MSKITRPKSRLRKHRPPKAVWQGGSNRNRGRNRGRNRFRDRVRYRLRYRYRLRVRVRDVR